MLCWLSTNAELTAYFSTTSASSAPDVKVKPSIGGLPRNPIQTDRSQTGGGVHDQTGVDTPSTLSLASPHELGTMLWVEDEVVQQPEQQLATPHQLG